MVAVKFEERYSRKYGSGRENYPQISTGDTASIRRAGQKETDVWCLGRSRVERSVWVEAQSSAAFAELVCQTWPPGAVW